MREVERLEWRISRDAARAIDDFSLIGEGDAPSVSLPSDPLAQAPLKLSVVQ